MPSDAVICRNPALIESGRAFAQRLVRIIETETGRRVKQLQVIAMCVDGVLWLHHLQEVSIVHRHVSNTVNVNALMSDSNSLMSSLSLATSLANIYLKPFAFCSGDFCKYLQGNGMDSLEEEDFDVKVEAQRAVGRHRRVQQADEVKGEEEAYEFDPHAIASTASVAFDAKSSIAQLQTVIAHKEHQILNKSLTSAREEMLSVESIEQQFNGTDQSTAQMVDMKERLGAIWPMHIVKWWLGVGQNQRKNPRYGRLSLVASKAPRGVNITNTANIFNPSDHETVSEERTGKLCVFMRVLSRPA